MILFLLITRQVNSLDQITGTPYKDMKLIINITPN